MILMVSCVTCRELIELKTDENVIVIVPLTLACKSMIIYKQNVVNNITLGEIWKNVIQQIQHFSELLLSFYAEQK